MENHKKGVNDLKRGPLAKLHDRIQRKYREMQNKINKSKSVGSIAMLDDKYDFKEKRDSVNSDMKVKRYSITSDLKEKRFASVSDLSEVYDKTSLDRQSVIVEVLEASLKIRDVEYDESSIFEAQFNDEDHLSALPFFDDDFKVSCESINELKSDGDLPIALPSPRRRFSWRDKLTSRKQSKELSKIDGIEKHILLSNSPKDIVLKKKQKSSNLTIALIEAKELGVEKIESISEEKSRIIQCRFRLGSEKRKSKPAKSHGDLTTFQELFTINVYDEYLLQISLWDKDTLLGKTHIDLSEVTQEKTHKMRINLEDGTTDFEIFFLLTLTGSSLDNKVDDFDEYMTLQKQIKIAKRNYMWSRLLGNFNDVGYLTIVVYGVKGISTNETYCVLQLGNETLHTHTVHSVTKGVTPRWNKVFTFNVADVTSILYVTVMDEKKSEVVGKISIFLLNITNGEKKWFALKDSTLREGAKGNNPKILLEMNLYWSLIKASVRVINPKEVILMDTPPKFQRQIFAQNLTRARAVLNWVFDAVRVLKTCFEWESRKLNTVALAAWLTFCWCFKAWMVPLLLLSPFFWYRKPEYFLVNWKKYILHKYYGEEKQDEVKEDEKKSLRQRFNTLQDMIQTVQNGIGKLASLGESIKNLFNFTVPFLSFLAIFFIVVITLLLYLVPIKYIFMAWAPVHDDRWDDGCNPESRPQAENAEATVHISLPRPVTSRYSNRPTASTGIHKYLRKILKPNRIPNNEILDLLSRVPDDEVLLDCQELNQQADSSNKNENDEVFSDSMTL